MPDKWDVWNDDVDEEPPDDVVLLPFARQQDVPSGPNLVSLDTVDTGAPPPLLLGRLDPEGHTILFGTGGVGKGALASWWIVGLVKTGHRVAILDYENHPEEWARRIDALAPGIRPQVYTMKDMRGSLNLASSAELKTELDRMSINYVVVDSAVMACGVDPLKPEAARSYGEGIVRLGRPVLTLAHVTKMDDARYPFGSIFWHNLARTTWSLTQDGPDQTLLTHRKANNYAKSGPLTVTMTWRDNLLREVWERSRAVTLADEIAELLEGGVKMTVKQIMESLEVDDRKVSKSSVTSALKRDLGPDKRFTCVLGDGEQHYKLNA